MRFLSAQHKNHGCHYVLTEVEGGIQVAAFGIMREFNAHDEQYYPHGVMSWKEFSLYITGHDASENHGSGLVDKTRLGTLVFGVPNAEKVALRYLGRCCFTPDGAAGYSEVTDHCIIDFQVNDDGLLPWSSRFAQTSSGKIASTHRIRAQNKVSSGVSIHIPFVDDGMDGWVVAAACDGDVETPTLLSDGKWEEVDVSKARMDGLWWEEFFFSVKGDAGYVAPDELAEVTVQLVSNSDNKPCRHAIELRVEADAGYLPNRRVKFDDDGKATVRFRAADMVDGESAKVKFSTATFSNVGSFVIDVKG